MTDAATTPSLPPILNEWCARQLGSFTVASAFAHDHGESHLWRLTTATHSYYLKQHRQARKWHNETHAYEHWTPVFGAYAPRPVAVHDAEPRAILLTELAGRPMAHLALSLVQEYEVWKSAGWFLAQLHALPPGRFFGPCLRDGQPQDGSGYQNAVSFMQHVLTRCLEQGHTLGGFTEAERALGRAAFTQVDVFADELPTACHRDYTPRNWMLTSNGEWSGVLDFEHARWDVRAADISHWWDLYQSGHPIRGEAFFAGYGGALTPQFAKQIVVARIMNALCRIVWAQQHRDRAFELSARHALARLQEEI